MPKNKNESIKKIRVKSKNKTVTILQVLCQKLGKYACEAYSSHK